MRDKDQGSGLQVTTPRRAPGDPGAEVEEYIGPGFRSRGLYGEVNPASEDTAASRGDGGTEPTPSRGRFAGCGPRGYRRPDARIAEDINEALTWHPDIDASEVEVAVEQGIVTLTGTVHDRRTQRLIREVTSQIVGVCELEDRLTVGPGGATGA
jgi:osmotically-inducible protein OsmY